MEKCTLSNDIFKSGNFTENDSLLLTLATKTPTFAKWYGNKPIELINDKFINDDGEVMYANQLLDNINSKKELLYIDKSDDYLSYTIAQLVGIESFEDEVVSNIPTERELIINNELRNLLKNNVTIINDKNNNEIHGDDFINLAHLSINDSFLMYYPALITKEDENLINNILQDINNNEQNWVNKKIIVSNLLNDYTNLPLKTQNKLLKLATNVSKRIGIADKVLSPTQEVMSFIEGINDFATMSELEYLVNLDNHKKEINNEYTNNIISPFRKVIFTVILDNLKEKFGIDYRWVDGDNTFHARLVKGIVEINKNNFNDSTPFHEYLHPIIMSLKVDNIDLYNQLISNSNVRKLISDLSQIDEYKDDAEEEALIMYLSDNFKNLTFTVTIQQFWIWVKNLFKKLFNINSEKLNFSSDINDISNLMLNAHKYDVSSFKLHHRYSFNRYELSKVIIKNKPTAEQREVMASLAKIEDRIKDYTKTTLPESYVLTHNTTKQVIPIKRATSLKLFQYEGSKEPAVIGEFLHDLFTEYLRLRAAGKIPTESGKNFIKPLKIDKVNSKNRNSDVYILNYVNPSDTIQEEYDSYPLPPYNTTMYESINEEYINNLKNDNPFTYYILKNIRFPEGKEQESVNIIQQIYRYINDQDIYYLYQMMYNMEKHIVDTVNNTEKLTGDKKVTLEDLVLYNEMFIHNFTETSYDIDKLYGGTLDVFVISPSGKKYNFDLKTTGTSKMKTDTAKLISSASKIYSIQQSVYRELLSFITSDKNLAHDIETFIIHMPRGINYEYNIDTFKKIVEDLINIINHNSIDYDNIKSTIEGTTLTKNEFIQMLQNAAEFAENEDSSLKDDYKTINNFIKNIIFVDVEHTNIKNSNSNLLKKIIETYNSNLSESNKYKIPSHDNNSLIYKNILNNLTGDLNINEISRIIPIDYNRKVLEELGVQILEQLSYHPFVVELNTFLDLIRKKIFILNQQLDKIDSTDVENQIDIENINSSINVLNHYKTLISANLISIFIDNNLTEDIIADIKRKIYIGKWDTFSKLLSSKVVSNDNYSEYLINANKLKAQIQESKEVLENIKKAQEADIKRLEKESKVLWNDISNLSLNRNITFTSNTLNINDQEIDNLNKKLLAVFHQLEKLKDNNKLLTENINAIEFNMRVLSNNINELYSKKSVQTIIDDANFHYNKIVNLIHKMSDFNIPLDIRAGYYTYITKTVELYKDLLILLPDTNTTLPDSLTLNLMDIQTKYEKLLKDSEDTNINNLFKMIIADMISTITVEGVNLAQTKHLADATLEEFNIWKTHLKSLYQNHTSVIDDFIFNNIDSFSQRAETANNNIKEFYNKKREFILNEIEKDLRLRTPALFLTWVRETFLPASRSVSILVNTFSILESEINGEYSANYRKISEEIQEKFAILIGKYDGKITNKIKIKDFVVGQEDYVVFDKFIAKTVNHNLTGNIDSSLRYLMNIIGDRYQYEFIFNEKELRDLKNLSLNEKENYIITKGLIDKYKIIKTMRLVDRVKYDYNDMFIEPNEYVKYFKNQLKFASSGSRPHILKKFKDSVKRYLSLKKDNTIQYNAINFHFISYLYHIQEFVGKMYDIHSSYFSDQNVYDTSKLLTQSELSYINDLLMNQVERVDIENFKNTFKNSNTIMGRSIYKAISVLQNETSLVDIANSLKDIELNRLKTIYGNNYANIFYAEGLENFSKFYGDQSIVDGTSDGKIKNTTFKRLELENNVKRDQTIEKLKSKDLLNDAKKDEIIERFNLELKNDELIFLMKYSPFNYILSVDYSDDENVFELFTGYRVKDIVKNIRTGVQFNVSDYAILNLPKGNINIFENGNEKHFDSDWDIMEDPQHEELFNFYNYFRETLKYFYSIIPRSEKNFGIDIDIPYMNNETFIRLVEELKKEGFDLSKIKDFYQNKFINRITSSVQNTSSDPSVMLKPVQIKNIEELYHITDKANYQLHTVLQMFAYNALLYKTRVDKQPLHNVILNIAKQSKNTETSTGAIFNYHVNNTGSIQRNIKSENQSYLSERTKENLNRIEVLIRDYGKQLKDLNKAIKIALENENYNALDDLNIKKNLIIYNLNHYKGKRAEILNSGKLDSIDITRTAVQAARMVQLTYSLTGQVGNYINGMIQTSVVASSSDEEMNAYIKSFEILNGLLFENKLLLGSAYAGNLIVSSLLGTAAGLISIPIWMTLAQNGLDKYKDLKWLEKRFNPLVQQAINMERNYDFTFDVVENSRAALPEPQLKKWDGNKVVNTSTDFVEMLKPFGFVKRAEKLIAIQNMIIQSFVTKVTINNKTYTFWELHDEHGTIKPEFEPFVSEQLKKLWKRQTEDRLHRANGNYTSKYQAENNWWGQLALVYSKWIPEIANNYWGDYTDETQNIFSGKAHEGIFRSVIKKTNELHYNLLRDKIIADFNVSLNEISVQDADDIIIFKNGKIITNNADKGKFISEYNSIVNSDSNEEPVDLNVLKNLVKKYNIKVFNKITPEEKKEIWSKLIKIGISMLSPFDFFESFKQRTLTRNVKDRLHKVLPENDNLLGYYKVQYANLRKFYNVIHVAYSIFFTKTLLMILLGTLTKVFDLDDDEKYIRQLTFVINRYNQIWEDITYFNNPASAFYNYFHNSMTTVKFALDIIQLNTDIAAAFPHAINGLLGDSEIGDVILESMGMRDPILERSKGITNVRPVNDFIDMIPLFNKLASIHKQSVNDYSNTEN